MIYSDRLTGEVATFQVISYVRVPSARSWMQQQQHQAPISGEGMALLFPTSQITMPLGKSGENNCLEEATASVANADPGLFQATWSP